MIVRVAGYCRCSRVDDRPCDWLLYVLFVMNIRVTGYCRRRGPRV